MNYNLLFWTSLIMLGGLPFVVPQQALRRTDEDRHFEKFLKEKMEGFTEWISKFDPSPITTIPVNLKSDKDIDDGVDADFTITNYNMSGHSKSYEKQYYILSDLHAENGRYIQIVEGYINNDPLLAFGGDYTVAGSILLENGSDVRVTFQGQGRWRLETFVGIQVLKLLNYTVTDDDYIDLDISLNNYEYSANIPWNKTEFEGLTVNEENFQNSSEEELIKRIQLALAGAYFRFLSSVYQHPIETQPIKWVLVEYLKEIFSATTFSDITGQTTITSTEVSTETSKEITTDTSDETSNPTFTSTSTPPPSNGSDVHLMFNWFVVCTVQVIWIFHTIDFPM